MPEPDPRGSIAVLDPPEPGLVGRLHAAVLADRRLPSTAVRRTTRWSRSYGIPAVACAVLLGLNVYAQRPARSSQSPPLRTSTLAGPLIDGFLSFPEALLPGRTFALQEDEAAFSVTPVVSLDQEGNFLVADSREAQIRRYSPTGERLAYFGRPGSGPGEFAHPTAALSLPDGRILTLEMGGRISVYRSDGTGPIATSQSGIAPLYGGTLVDGRTALLTGRRTGPDGTRLVHVWDLAEKRLVRSFFPVPAHDPSLDGAYTTVSFTDAEVRGDTVAVLFALSDSLHFFGLDGEPRGTVPIPFRGFRPLREPLPSQATPAETQRWMGTFSKATHLFWLSDGSLIVQYSDLVDFEARWHLLGMQRDGQRLWEVRDAPKLLAVRPEPSRLIFDASDAEGTTRWMEARPRFAAAEAPAQR